jgi:hypothetical protein
MKMEGMSSTHPAYLSQPQNLSLQIMYTIHGGKDLEEIELNHLAGHKDSK